MESGHVTLVLRDATLESAPILPPVAFCHRITLHRSQVTLHRSSCFTALKLLDIVTLAGTVESGHVTVLSRDVTLASAPTLPPAACDV